jgi:hypothetical protein
MATAVSIDAALIEHFRECEELCMLTGDFERALQYRIFAQEARDGVLWQRKDKGKGLEQLD